MSPPTGASHLRQEPDQHGHAPRLAGGGEEAVVLASPLLSQLLGRGPELVPGQWPGRGVDLSLLQVLDVIQQQRVVLLVRDEWERVGLAAEDVVAINKDARRVGGLPLGKIRDEVIQRLCPALLDCLRAGEAGRQLKDVRCVPVLDPEWDHFGQLGQRQAIVCNGDVRVHLLVGG